MRNFIFLFSTVLINISLYSQSFNKAWQNLENRIKNKEYLTVSEKTNFLAKYEKDFQQHPIEKSILINGLGHDAYEQENYPEAISQFELANKLAIKAGDSTYAALYKYDLANLYNHVGYYTVAEPLYILALPTLSEYYGQSSLAYTMCFKKLAEMYIEMGRYNEAKTYNDALLYYFKTLKGERDHEYLVCLNNDARISEGIGDYLKSLEIFKNLLSIYSTNKSIDTAGYITILNNTAESYRHISNYTEAIKLQEQAIDLFYKSSNGSEISLATCYNNIGLCFKGSGDYQKSEEAFNNSIKIYEKLKLTFIPDYTNPLSNKADLYRILGRNKQAGDILQQVLAIRKNSLGVKHVYYANSLTNFALVRIADYTSSGMAEHLEDAEKYLLEAKEIYKEALGEYHPNYANCLNNLAMIYIYQKKYKEAENLKLRALEINKKMVGEDHEKYANILASTTSVYEGLGNYSMAIQNLEQAIQIYKTKLGQNHVDYIDARFNMAYLKWKTKDYKSAEELFIKSMAAYKKQFDAFFNSMSENDQLVFYQEMNARFDMFNSFVMNYTKALPKENHIQLVNNCFNNQLFLKSILLNQSVNTRKNIFNSKDTSLINLYNQWLDVKQTLAGLYRGTDFEKTYWKESDLQEKSNTLEQKIKSQLKQFQGNKQLYYTDIASALKEKEAALYIVRTESIINDTTSELEYIALLLKKSSAPQLIRLKDSDYFEKEYILFYDTNIETKQKDEHSYNRFWKPIAEHLNGITTVYVCTDGIYNQINLYTLQNPINNQYLIDQISISLVPNLSALVSSNTTNINTNNTAELYGYPDYEFNFKINKSEPKISEALATSRFGFSELPPLPGTQTEVNNISSTLRNSNWNVKVFTKEQATESQLKKTESPKVLHIATHGFFLKDVMENTDKSILGFESNAIKYNPLLRSGIMMAGASVVARDTANTHQEQDGIFTAYEASFLNLNNTDLVVLSACETGLGVNLNNQGVFGLQRSFYIAGAKKLIMSLWVVDDDATQLLMSTFYSEWSKNSSHDNISVAFKKAQNEVRKKYSHPYYWGAFVLLGQ